MVALGVFPRPEEEQQAVCWAEDEVVFKKRKSRADEDSSGQVEETFLAVFTGMEPVPLGQHHPTARVKPRIDYSAAARADGAGPPVRADGTEADVVEQVPGEHPPSDEADQIPVQGRPRRDVAGAGGCNGRWTIANRGHLDPGRFDW